MTMTKVSYLPLHKPNQLIYGRSDSPVVIVCGWTLKETVAKYVPGDYYAAIGQLYSASRGISFLIRNLLANPHIRYIVALGTTEADRNSGSIQTLRDFFLTGVKREGGNWRINSEILGLVDGTIPLSDLELLRESVEFYQAHHINEVATLCKGLPANSPGVWGEPRTYPMPEAPTAPLPCSLVAHRVQGTTVAQCWPQILKVIRGNGVLRPTGYDGQVQELINLVTVVTDEPNDLHIPVYLPINREFMQSYLPGFLEDSPAAEGVKYTYGQRMRSWFGRDQVADVVAKLRVERDSASAVINLWDSSLDNIKSGSPCLNHLWFRITERGLVLTATLRSNDMFAAWPANALALRVLQTEVRDLVDGDLPLGELVTISQSAHLYDDTFESADKVIADHCQGHAPALSDPVGNFIIERESGCAVVTQTHPETGEVVALYKGKAPLKVVRAIASRNPSIKADHLGYLGIEIYRACTDTAYVQDR